MFAFRYEKLREFEAPIQINTASLHPEKSIFISGGEDFKMYKFDYETGTELGKSVITDHHKGQNVWWMDFPEMFCTILLGFLSPPPPPPPPPPTPRELR